MSKKYFLLPLASGAAMMLIAGCASSGTAPEQAPVATAPSARHPGIVPVIDDRAMKEMKAMANALSGAKTMSFVAMTMKPVHGPNDQWIHVLTTDAVEMQRPDKLFVTTGGDAYPQRIYFESGNFAVIAPEAKLHTTREMAAKTIDGMLAEASQVGGVSFPFADVLLTDPLVTWEKDLEGALYIGQSSRGGEKLNHIAMTAKDVDWEIWTDVKTHLPRIVHVKFIGEHRAPSLMMEFSKWKLNEKIKSSDFAFKAPKESKSVSFAAPGEGK